jgi:hypothetical protein
MNRREAILAGVAGIAAAVAVPPAANAQASTAENPELEKGAILGTGPGEIWSGADEIKAAHQRLFEGFDKGEQEFDYEFNVGGVISDTGWMLTSGNVTGSKDGNEFTFPVNISLTVLKDSGKWLILAMHYSILEAEDEQ